MVTKEYHILRSSFGGNGAGQYYWVRTDGLMDTQASTLFAKQKECVDNAKANALRLQVKPIIIR